ALEAEVASVASSADPLGMVRFRLRPKVAEGLIAGMRLPGEVVVATRRSVVVPKSAVVLRRDGAFVFVAENGRAHARKVQLGRELANGFEITAGVQEGERVVSDGAGFLEDGALIREQR
ncbi:MAG: hypothetical protein D6771_07035, partial [Zetaproteobacteria bacterium]